MVGAAGAARAPGAGGPGKSACGGMVNGTSTVVDGGLVPGDFRRRGWTLECSETAAGFELFVAGVGATTVCSETCQNRDNARTAETIEGGHKTG